ncbi:glycosyltransferase family 2 protein [Pseudomonas sp. NPDC098747]|uniref:glycosyltransferase family 2 protein n=1 Tax=Pseudomonas sp. NPDC098747 TaxID=3364487 RepID=UPI00383ADD22
MLTPKISVVIAAYNVENYITETMRSILGQRVQPWEIVIIDDGSTDGTLSLINMKYGHDPKIKIITQENQGVGAARTAGFKATTGDFIFFCDPDDVVSRTLFNDFANVFIQNNALELYYFSKRSFIDAQGERRYMRRDTAPTREGWYRERSELLEDLIVNNKYKAATWQYIFRKSLTDRFDVSFKGRAHEDQLFSMNIYLHSRLCYATRSDRYFQRIRQGSITNSVKDEHHVLSSYATYRETLAVLKAHLDRFPQRHQVATSYMRRGVTWTTKGCVRNRVRLPGEFFALTRRDSRECGVGNKDCMLLILPEWHYFAKKVGFELKRIFRRRHSN